MQENIVNQTDTISEEGKNLVGFFEVLIKIDKRLQNEAQKEKKDQDD